MSDRMRATGIALLSLAGALLLASPAQGGVSPPLPSVVSTPTVSPFPVKNHLRRYPIYDAQGHLRGYMKWLVTPAGGNCCEDYVAAQPNGRLLSFGGTYPMYSDTGGRTWKEVKPVTPLNNGEGAIVAAPNGDIAGIGWDAYSGDHAQSFKYDAVHKTWTVAEVLIKNPFFDRPWITVARGPFTINGQTYPYVYIVRGGGVNKDPEFISTDGLTYSQFTSQAMDESSTTKGPPRYLAVKHLGLADFWAPHPWAGTIPLTGGGLLQISQPNDGDQSTCAVNVFKQSNGNWGCSKFSPPFLSRWTKTTEVCCQVRQDSRGWLSDVVPEKVSGARALLYRQSTDGGRTWSKSTVLTPPKGGVLEADGIYNVVVNGHLGLAAVSARFDNTKTHNGQDQVFVVDVRRPQPKLLYTLLVGKGNVRTANDVSGTENDRFDYASVAITPNGAIATSFDDSTTQIAPQTLDTYSSTLYRNQLLHQNQPNLAIMQRSALTLFPKVHHRSTRSHHHKSRHRAHTRTSDKSRPPRHPRRRRGFTG